MQPKCQFLTTLQKKNSPIMALYSFSKTSSSKPILLYRRTDRILSCKDGMNNKRKEKVLLTLKQFWPWTLWHALLCVPLAPPCLHMSSRRWKFWRFCIVVFKVFFQAGLPFFRNKRRISPTRAVALKKYFVCLLLLIRGTVRKTLCTFPHLQTLPVLVVSAYQPSPHLLFVDLDVLR